MNAHGLTGAWLIGRGNCRGPLPIITLGREELTFEPHSTQDLEALGDMGPLWDAKCSPECVPPGCMGSKSLSPRNPTLERPQPQPCQPTTKCMRNPDPRLDSRTLALPHTDRLGEPLHTKELLALGKQDLGQPAERASSERWAGLRPMLGGAGGTLGERMDRGETRDS